MKNMQQIENHSLSVPEDDVWIDDWDNQNKKRTLQSEE